MLETTQKISKKNGLRAKGENSEKSYPGGCALQTHKKRYSSKKKEKTARETVPLLSTTQCCQEGTLQSSCNKQLSLSL